MRGRIRTDRHINSHRRWYRPFRGGSDGRSLDLSFTSMATLTDLTSAGVVFARSGSATFINSSGLIDSAADGNPRFEYSPVTPVARGLLIEGQTQNYLFRSNAFNTSPWAANGYTFSTGSTTPHASESSQRLTVSGSGTLGILQSNAVTGTSVTFSVWWKNGNWTGSTGSSPREIGIRNNTTSTMLLRFRIDNPTTTPTAGYITGSSGVSFQSYGNGWYRIIATVTTGITSGNTIAIYLGGLLGTFIGSGEYADWYGAQLEVGSGATSYIPTVASQITRSSETAYIPLANFGFNTVAGTFVAQYRPMQGNRGSNQPGSVISTDYALSRWVGLNRAYNSTTVNAQSWSNTLPITAGSTVDKAGFTYSDWDGAEVVSNFSVNNSAVTTGGLDWDPTLPTNLVIGAASSSSPYTSSNRDYLNSCVARITYWPFVLPNATLQGLTV